MMIAAPRLRHARPRARASLAVLCVSLLGTGVARAEDFVLRPTAQERAWVRRCLARLDDRPVGQMLTACSGKVTAACLGLERAPKLPYVRGRNAHPRTCAPVEERVWNALIDQRKNVVPDARRAAFEAEQRRWDAMRRAKCSARGESEPNPLGLDIEADCLMEEAARRAIALREAARRRPAERGGAVAG